MSLRNTRGFQVFASLKLDVGGFRVAYSPATRTGSEFVDLTMISKNGKFIR